MNFISAFFAGVISGLVMTILLAFARLIGLTMLNVEMALGSMLTEVLSLSTWFLGLGVHLVISGLIACLYAIGFEYLLSRANWIMGAGLAVIHLILGGLFLGTLGDWHPLMVPPPLPAPAGYLMAPGIFALNFGQFTAIALVVVHLIFGAMVGSIYEEALEQESHAHSAASGAGL